MSTTMHDDLEVALTELFDRQAAATPVNRRAWDDPPAAMVIPMNSRRSRPAVAAIVSAAAAVALVIGIVAVAPGGGGIRVAGQPGTAAKVHFATAQVSLSADALLIDAGGTQFTAGGSVVDVHSDPGTPNKYTTLELDWNERGVEMRLFIYFTSDGHDWWSNEIRTYNGKSPGDWIYYTGTYFRSPLGAAFAGNVNVSATEGKGNLRLSDLRLEPFLPPAACKNATTRLALDPAYDEADMSTAGGFGLGVTRLLDATTCTPVTDPRAFAYDWSIADPAVALIQLDADQPGRGSAAGLDPGVSMNLLAKGPGSTTLHVAARRRSTGQVVATADIAVTVG